MNTSSHPPPDSPLSSPSPSLSSPSSSATSSSSSSSFDDVICPFAKFGCAVISKSRRLAEIHERSATHHHLHLLTERFHTVYSRYRSVKRKEKALQLQLKFYKTLLHNDTIDPKHSNNHSAHLPPSHLPLLPLPLQLLLPHQQQQQQAHEDHVAQTMGEPLHDVLQRVEQLRTQTKHNPRGETTAHTGSLDADEKQEDEHCDREIKSAEEQVEDENENKQHLLHDEVEEEVKGKVKQSHDAVESNSSFAVAIFETVEICFETILQIAANTTMAHKKTQEVVGAHVEKVSCQQSLHIPLLHSLPTVGQVSPSSSSCFSHHHGLIPFSLTSMSSILSRSFSSSSSAPSLSSASSSPSLSTTVPSWALTKSIPAEVIAHERSQTLIKEDRSQTLIKEDRDYLSVGFEIHVAPLLQRKAQQQ